MGETRILVVQNEEESPIGLLDEPAARREAVLEAVLPGEGDPLPPDDEGFDGLIVLGGSMNAEEDAVYPHLRDLVKLIRDFHRRGKPVLGICLGSQLVARAFGARVHRDRGSEIGFLPTRRTPEAAGDPLLSKAPNEVHLIQYHFDSFDLPENAVRLLTNGTCPNQAFRLGRTTYAFQAHIEAAPELMQQWLAMEADFIASYDPSLPKRFAEEAKTHGRQAHAFAMMAGDAWFAMAARLRQPSRELAPGAKC